MARAIPEKQNGQWLVLVDVDTYGGEEMTPAQARGFANALKRAADDAEQYAERDNA
jgi:hypothetical protein